MRRSLLAGFTCLVVLFIIAPLLVLAFSSFDDGKFFRFPPRELSLRWYRAAFASAEYRSSLVNSAVVGALATTISVVLGTTAAVGLHRGMLKSRAALEMILLAPLTLPLVIWAIALLQIYSWLGIGGTLPGLLLAHATFTLPFSVRIMLASLASIDPGLELAARSLGAKPARASVRITLPLALPGVATSAALSFFISFNDVIVSTFIAGSSWMTFPVRLYSQLRGQGIDPTTLAIGTMIIVSILVAVVLTEVISKRALRT
ncbi:ABC transporter permease [Tropicimonas sediminicola]|uniref:Putative spermidine/putrescine transport system permease protein n=1 Tax=Tropicimonas sediminicola TaxID=1031541 RepID=A0A239LE64_9RHOB|nr:ABC transporter permease [Tropicimonas sediminicola]SNT28936.1 putative spermidine/putrescine transport system permease protein [Tropicimonas sediminicola]